MSRTIRRKGDKKHNHSGKSSFLESYTTDYPDYWEGRSGIVTAWGGLPHLPMIGHEYYEKYYMFHRDTHLVLAGDITNGFVKTLINKLVAVIMKSLQNFGKILIMKL